MRCSATFFYNDNTSHLVHYLALERAKWKSKFFIISRHVINYLLNYNGIHSIFTHLKSVASNPYPTVQIYKKQWLSLICQQNTTYCQNVGKNEKIECSAYFLYIHT